jgi:hypothetical protein
MQRLLTAIGGVSVGRGVSIPSIENWKDRTPHGYARLAPSRRRPLSGVALQAGLGLLRWGSRVSVFLRVHKLRATAAASMAASFHHLISSPRR